jgi:uncharacterized protein (DUF2252 family)
MTAVLEGVAKRAPRGAGGRTRIGDGGEQLSRAERVDRGKAARTHTPLESHADLGQSRSRDPIALLLSQSTSRVPELVPIRHGRMLVSPFTFFRGAALPMTVDLAHTPVSGIRVQLCGDAHLSNFGAFASPSRRLVFDVNDFDETLPGPFEWDIKRLAASFSVAGRDNGLAAKVRRRIAAEVARSYRTAMRGFADQSLLDVWYAHLDVEDAMSEFSTGIKAKRVKTLDSMVAKARTRDSMQALDKLTTVVDGERQIVSTPPTIVPIEEVFGDWDSSAIYELIGKVVGTYRRSVQSDKRHLLEQFTLNRVARKVVGVGSVGTRAWVVLMDAGDGEEPLFLQAKEAQPSVLAEFCGHSEYRNDGERVVAGQRLMQAVTDIFLGWTHVVGPDGTDRAYYVRQLRDWKMSVPIELLRPPGMMTYARLCGWTLARAHARSGDRIALAAYLGGSDKFDQAIADFAEAYADQNDSDYAEFQVAVKQGLVDAVEGV